MEYRKVLEVGFGGDPLGIKNWHPEGLKRGGFIPPEETIPLFLQIVPRGVVYYGVDFPDRLTQKEIESYRNMCKFYIGAARNFLEYNSMNPKSEQMVVAVMDARQLSYPDVTFDEVHMHYVLTDPSVTGEDSNRMLSEAHRVLKPDHSLVVSGEKYRLSKGSNEVQDLEDDAKRSIVATGMSVDNSKDALERATVFHDAVRNLYTVRNTAVDFSSCIDPEAYLIVAWKI